METILVIGASSVAMVVVLTIWWRMEKQLGKDVEQEYDDWTKDRAGPDG